MGTQQIGKSRGDPRVRCNIVSTKNHYLKGILGSPTDSFHGRKSRELNRNKNRIEIKKKVIHLFRIQHRFHNKG